MMLSEGTGFGHLYSNLFGGRMPDYTNSTDNLTLFQKLHLQLAEIIEKTPAGEKLKSEPELAASLGVSRATLREAMRSFEGQGLIRRRQGVGTFVLDQKQNIESGLEILESIETQANRLGMDVKMGYLGISRENAGEIISKNLGINRSVAGKDIAAKLGISEHAQIVKIARVIWVSDHPVAYLIDTLPIDVLPEEDLINGFTGSVLDLLIKRETYHLSHSKTYISACPASSDIAKKIQMQRGDVVQKFEAYLYENSGRILDYSESYFAPGFFKFHVIRKIGY